MACAVWNTSRRQEYALHHQWEYSLLRKPTKKHHLPYNTIASGHIDGVFSIQGASGSHHRCSPEASQVLIVSWQVAWLGSKTYPEYATIHCKVAWALKAGTERMSGLGEFWNLELAQKSLLPLMGCGGCRSEMATRKVSLGFELSQGIRKGGECIILIHGKIENTFTRRTGMLVVAFQGCRCWFGMEWEVHIRVSQWHIQGPSS